MRPFLAMLVWASVIQATSSVRAVCSLALPHNTLQCFSDPQETCCVTRDKQTDRVCYHSFCIDAEVCVMEALLDDLCLDLGEVTQDQTTTGLVIDNVAQERRGPQTLARATMHFLLAQTGFGSSVGFSLLHATNKPLTFILQADLGRVGSTHVGVWDWKFRK